MTTLDLTPPIADLILYRGDTQPITFSYMQRSTGELQSLTGATAKMYLKNEIGSDIVIYEFPLTINTAQNTITMSITNWGVVTWVKGLYDLEVTYQSGVIETWCRGTFELKGDIS